jgi:uncharacterized membrane protein
MKYLIRAVALIFALAFLLAALAIAQQTQPRKVPRMTSDDVVKTRSAPSASEIPPVEIVPAMPSPQVKVTPPPVDLEGAKSPDEKAWRIKVAQARQQAEETQRAAEQAEVGTTELRNSLNTQGQTSQQRNATAAEMDAAGKQVVELRKVAAAAKDELRALLAEGLEKGYSEGAGIKPVTKTGTPNEEYYRQKYQELLQAVADAQRRIKLYEDRIRALNELITNPNRDRFGNARLEQDRQDAKDNLAAAENALSKAQEDIEKLKAEANQAGIAPGVFR